MDDTLSAHLSLPVPPPVPLDLPLHLPAELTIYTVGELHPQWLAWLAGDDAIAAVQGEVVDQVDAAGLQLLLALQRALADRGRQLELRSPSAALRGGCEALGLGGWLALHSAGPAA